MPVHTSHIRFSRKGTATYAAALLLTLVGPLRAAERITLANGFDLVCDHRSQVDGRVRLYQDPSGQNYIELQPDEISAVEQLAAVPTIDSPPFNKVVSPVSQPLPVTPSALSAPPTSAFMEQLLTNSARARNVDVDLLASVVKTESGGNAHAVSRTGAQGLMQLMPATAKQLQVEDSFEPGQNIHGGTAYLDQLLTRYHNNIALALAAYNAGPGAVDKYHGVPPYRETRAYVARVIREFNRRVSQREQARRLSSQRADSQTAHPNTKTADRP